MLCTLHVIGKWLFVKQVDEDSWFVEDLLYTIVYVVILYAL